MSEHKMKPHPNEIIDTEKYILTLGGIYPREEHTRLFYYVGFLITLFFSFGLFFTMSIDLFIEKEMSQIISILYYLPQQTAYVIKLINFIIKGNEMKKIEEIFEMNLFNLHKEHQYDYLNDAIRKTRIIANVFRLLCCLVVLFYALPPMFTENMKIPLPGWYPFDVEKYAVYIYLFEVTAVFVSATINSNIDILDVRLISMGTAQLNVLMSNLENVVEDDEIKHLKRENLEKIVEERLKVYVKHHQIILEFISYVENIFTYGIFGQFILSMMVICMTGFNMLMVSIQSWDFVLLIIFFSCMTNQIAIYCWYGNDIVVKSVGIIDSCFASKWYEYSPKINKLVWIVMERSKRPIKLTAGYFLTLSLATFMSVVRSSYSYFAVLQRMYAKEEK